MTSDELVAMSQGLVAAQMEQQGDPEALSFFQSLLSDQLVFRPNGKVVGKSGPGAPMGRWAAIATFGCSQGPAINGSWSFGTTSKPRVNGEIVKCG